MRSNLLAQLSRSGRAGPRAARFRPPQQVHRLAVRPALADHLQPQIDRSALRARLLASQPTSTSTANTTAAEYADEDEGLDARCRSCFELRVRAEQIGRQRDAVGHDLIEEARPDTGRLEAALDHAVRADAGLTVSGRSPAW